MRVIVVKARAIAENEVALDFAESEGALGVLREVVSLVDVLEEFLDAKSAGVAVRIFAGIIPAHADAGRGSAADQRDRFGNDIQVTRHLPGDPDFRFGAELDVHKLSGFRVAPRAGYWTA